MQQLYNALRFDRQYSARLSLVERMLINSERATQLASLDFSRTHIRCIPPDVELKVQEIARELEQYRFIEVKCPLIEEYEYRRDHS